MTWRDPGRLPVDVTSFVGRGQETAEVRRLLGASRLVTLTGPGGVGKTRLALRVAEQERGARLVELAELNDPALVAHTVAGQLGVPDPAGGDITDALVEHLAHVRGLLVLDNCEHLVDAVAKLVDRVARAAPEVRVLATSRESLGVVGEVGFAVRPLPVPDPETVSSAAEVLAYDGAGLLVDRALAVRPDFVVDEHNYSAVAALCGRLDGIPLAIELAAVRLRSLSVEEIVQRLGDRFRLLTLGRRVGPARHQTLLATIEWSYALCSPAERALWARAALFPGGFELDAIEAVADEPDVLDLLASLVDKSILAAEGGGHTRYVMLETIRDFGLGQLDSAELAALRRRHRDFYADLIERLRLEYAAGAPVAAIARTAREQGNLRAALEFCVTSAGEARAGLRLAAGLLNYWSGAVPAEGAQWLDRLLDADPEPSRERAQALCDRAWLPISREGQSTLGFLDEADRIIAELDIGSGLEATLVERSRATVHLSEGRVTVAAEMLARVVDWFDRWVPGTEWERVYREYSLLNSRTTLAHAYSAAGEPREAEALLREILPIASARGHLAQLSVARWNLGALRLEDGDLAEASDLARSSLVIARDIDDRTCVMDGMRLLGLVAAAKGDADRAALLLGATDEIDHDNASLMISGWESAMVARYRALARAALGDEAFSAAHRRGGELTTANAVALALDDKPSRPPRPVKSSALTRRQLEVAKLVAQGKSNRAIAAALTISIRTAETHVDHILTALGFNNRAQIAAWMASSRDEV
ncbi:helix-turn-helix transcriptional regulator [Actinokineospora sp. HUAS TT18]|uniref:helix-turn-helix transcriptional regulator n=1 Tax=Actinokineospora sp. HUAS TT18 TaxID=3447451 RepID=UPI003F52611E